MTDEIDTLPNRADAVETDMNNNLSQNENDFEVSDEPEMITPEMIAEEEQAAQESQKEFEARMWEMRQREFDKEQAEQSRKRLQFLVERAGIYSKWLAEKLEARQSEFTNQDSASDNISNKETVQDSNLNQKELEKSGEESISTKENDSDDEAALLARQPVTRRKSKRVSAQKDQSISQEKKRKADKSVTNASSIKRGRTKLGVSIGASSSKSAESALIIPPRTGRQPALVTGCTMREYQLVGMEWLISLYDNGLNGILADEMGLGKTLQTLAFLAHLREMGTTGPFLIVAPLSTLANWVAESERFTPTIPVVLYHGNPTERMYIRNHKLKFDTPNHPIVVTSYEICMKDRKYLQHVLWKYIVVDEGHRIKNLNCRLIRELKSYNSANRLLLTGTPLQNNLSELWSLLNFLMPDIFDDLTAFEGWFEFANDLSTFNIEVEESSAVQQEESSNLVSSLHQILKPFLLRRVKTEVAADLPKKREYMLFAPLVPKQKQLYDAALRGDLAGVIASNLEENLNGTEFENKENANIKNVPQTADSSSRSARAKDRVDYKELSDKKYFEELEKSQPSVEAKSDETDEMDQKAYIQKLVKSQKLQSLIVQLRKVCNHPYLFDIDGDDELDTDDRQKKLGDSNQQSMLPDIVSWSGKMMILERLLPCLFEKGHKVLIFSQMTRMLDILADWFEFIKKWRFCRIDGSVAINDRRDQIQAFNTNADIKLFLLSTRAGGLGINLTAADTVIIFDSDWNPQADLQAQDRVHRIGQSKPVIIYRLVTADTVEEKILAKAKAKRKLEKLVIHKEQFKGSGSYYKSNKVTTLSELAAILTSDDGVQVNAAESFKHVSKLSRRDLEKVLSEEELARITDRSPQSYEEENQSESSHVRIIQEDLETDANDVLNSMGA